jgi:hypothetical protein
MVSNEIIIAAALILSTGTGILSTAFIKDQRVIKGSDLRVLEHICKKNDGVKEFKKIGSKYFIHCNDGATWQDIEIRMEDKQQQPKDNLSKMKAVL